MSSLNHQRLAKAIAASGLKKAEVARAIGVTPGTLSRYLGGHLTPDMPVLLNCSRVLTVTVEWLLGVTPDTAGPGLMAAHESISGQHAPLRQVVDQPVARESDPVYLPDAVALTGLDVEERQTMLRMLDALQSGDAEIRRHLIGQLKIIEVALNTRRKQPRKEQEGGS